MNIELIFLGHDCFTGCEICLVVGPIFPMAGPQFFTVSSTHLKPEHVFKMASLTIVPSILPPFPAPSFDPLSLHAHKHNFLTVAPPSQKPDHRLFPEAAQPCPSAHDHLQHKVWVSLRCFFLRERQVHSAAHRARH